MSHSFIGLIYLIITFGAAFLGVRLRSILPASHFEEDSKDSIKLVIGLIATISALVLGLITASAKSSFDSVDDAVKQSAVQILTLDRLLARYGSETTEIRNKMKSAVAERIKVIWPDGLLRRGAWDPFQSGMSAKAEGLGAAIRALRPGNEDQKELQRRANDLEENLLEGRWAIFAGSAPSISFPFVLILLFWLAITFLSFGLFAPRNGTVYVAFFVCALSVASAIFLVLELNSPFDGLIRISKGPMQFTYEHLGE